MGDAKDYIALMEDDHSVEGDRFRTISDLTDTTILLLMHAHISGNCLLQEFEENLHRHIHLEIIFFFPKAIELTESIAE